MAEGPQLSAILLSSSYLPSNPPNFLLLFLIHSQPVNHNTIQYRVPQYLSNKQHFPHSDNPLIAHIPKQIKTGTVIRPICLQKPGISRPMCFL